MRVVVLGAYGVFGSRLAELLIRDGHEVWLAGRSLEKAQAMAVRTGGKPLAVDRRGDLEPLFALQPEVVVDAAGPFHSYGEAPYRVARRCIEQGAAYLDLSDNVDFTAGIMALDDKAQERGRRVLSGASSVPGLSSAVAKELSCGFQDILLIDTIILPGNRAPRGASVIGSIVAQAGRPASVWRGGVWRDITGWSDRRRYRLGSGLTRDAYFLDVPDNRLFPEAFRARSVTFRAGMELRVLNIGLSALARWRRAWPFRPTPGRVRLLQWLANLLLPFGSDRGGMQVAVTGRSGEAVRRRVWTLIAEKGEGPFIPGIVVRALLRRRDRIPAGARPCLAEVTLAEIEQAMSDLAVSNEMSEGEHPTLFQAALGDRWLSLPAEVRALHSAQDVESFSGIAQVTRGSSPLARLAAWFFGFPPAGEDVPLAVTKTRIDDGEIWERSFAGRVFRSHCTPATEPYRYRERFWLFNYEQDLPVEQGSLHLPVRRGWFLGIPIPRFLLPRSDSREYAVDGQFHFDVALSAPLGGGLIVRYRGTLTPDGLSQEPPFKKAA